jgi:hypothetical protein
MTGEICRFGLIVTGEGEEQSLPQLFRVLMAKAHCVFQVIRRVRQRSPITAPDRIRRMVGSGRRLPTKDEEEVGVPVLLFLRRNPGSYAMVVDDLEGARRAIAANVFGRYRTALDAALAPSNLQTRGSAFPCEHA